MQESAFINRLRSRSLISVLIALMTILLLVAAGCGGSEEEASVNNTPGGATSGAGGSDSVTPGAQSRTPSGDQTSGNVSQKLQSAAKDWAKSSGKVVYDVTQKQEGKTEKSKMTLFWAPPRSRFDITSEVQGQNIEINFIVTPEKNYMCMQASKQCIASQGDASGAASMAFFGELTDPDAIEKAVEDLGKDVKVETSSQKVAGKDSTCFTFNATSAGQPGVTKWCFSDGLLLLMSQTNTNDKSEFTLQATSVSKTSDGDFKPPYAVTEVPGGAFPAPTR